MGVYLRFQGTPWLCNMLPVKGLGSLEGLADPLLSFLLLVQRDRPKRLHEIKPSMIEHGSKIRHHDIISYPDRF